MKRAAIYVRVSTAEQKKHGLSVDNQIKALEDYCQTGGYEIAGIYNDAGISARKKYTRRPGLLKMISDCQNGKIDIVLFTKLDRFFRSVPDYYACVEQMNGVPWRAIWEDYETETSAGVFKVNIMLSVAQAEADRTSERIKSTMEYKRDRGDFVGKAPTGYVIQNRQLVFDPDKKDAMQAIFDTMLRTHSVAEAVRVGAKNGVMIDRIHMYKLLRNPSYAGHMKNGYRCPAYITWEQHEELVSSIGKGPRRPKVEGRVYLFSGLVYCGYCGRRMAAHNTKRIHAGGIAAYYQKYDCVLSNARENHPHIQITETILERYLINNLDAIMNESLADIRQQNALVDTDGPKRKAALESKLKRLANLYADGDISRNDYVMKRDAIKDEIGKIVVRVLPEPEPLPDEWQELYELLDLEHRRSFWHRIIDRIEFTNETKNAPRITFRV